MSLALHHLGSGARSGQGPAVTAIDAQQLDRCPHNVRQAQSGPIDVGPVPDRNLRHSATDVVAGWLIGQVARQDLDIEDLPGHERFGEDTVRARRPTKHLGAALRVVDGDPEERRCRSGGDAADVVPRRGCVRCAARASARGNRGQPRDRGESQNAPERCRYRAGGWPGRRPRRRPGRRHSRAPAGHRVGPPRPCRCSGPGSKSELAPGFVSRLTR